MKERLGAGVAQVGFGGDLKFFFSLRMYPEFHSIVQKSIRITVPLHFEDAGKARPALKGSILTAIVNGALSH